MSTREPSNGGCRAFKKNGESRNKFRTRPNGNDDLVSHYEQLRRDALSLSVGRTSVPGVALFLRKGMTAWMRAWKPYLTTDGATTAPPPATNLHDSFDIRAQIATIVAGIILGRKLEATT